MVCDYQFYPQASSLIFVSANSTLFIYLLNIDRHRAVILIQFVFNTIILRKACPDDYQGIKILLIRLCKIDLTAVK